MISIKSFEIDDLYRFDPKDDFEDLERDMSKNILDTNKTMFSLLWKGRVLAVLGVTEFRRGAGELWLLPSILVDECKFGFFKTVKNIIYKFVFEGLEFHRLEIAILAKYEKGKKWARALGFNESHLCEAYDCNYQDHVIFYKVKTWQ